MADIILCRDEAGKLDGLTDADRKRWVKFRSAVAALAPGDTLKASFKLPRSPKFHRFHFAVLAALFACQEQFTDPERFRQWVQIGAGFCDLMPGPKGKPVAISRSIAWENLDEAEFAEHHKAVIEFVRSLHFSRFLWPHLSDQKGSEMVEAILQEFEH